MAEPTRTQQMRRSGTRILVPSLTIALAALGLAACAQPGGAPASAPVAQLTAPAPKQTAILRPAPSPESLVGKSPAAIERALGTPAFEGRDGDARIWRYSAETCSLLVIFYEDEAGEPKSAYLDARKPHGGEAQMGACLSDVVNTPRA